MDNKQLLFIKDLSLLKYHNTEFHKLFDYATNSLDFPRPINSNIPACTFHGSAKGCKYGTNCKDNHSSPNSVRKCVSYFKYNHCSDGDRCRFRHKIFIDSDLMANLPKFIKQYPDMPYPDEPLQTQYRKSINCRALDIVDFTLKNSDFSTLNAYRSKILEYFKSEMYSLKIIFHLSPNQFAEILCEYCQNKSIFIELTQLWHLLKAWGYKKKPTQFVIENKQIINPLLSIDMYVTFVARTNNIQQTISSDIILFIAKFCGDLSCGNGLIVMWTDRSAEKICFFGNAPETQHMMINLYAAIRILNDKRIYAELSFTGIIIESKCNKVGYKIIEYFHVNNIDYYMLLNKLDRSRFCTQLSLCLKDIIAIDQSILELLSKLYTILMKKISLNYIQDLRSADMVEVLKKMDDEKQRFYIPPKQSQTLLITVSAANQRSIAKKIIQTNDLDFFMHCFVFFGTITRHHADYFHTKELEEAGWSNFHKGKMKTISKCLQEYHYLRRLLILPSNEIFYRICEFCDDSLQTVINGRMKKLRTSKVQMSTAIRKKIRDRFQGAISFTITQKMETLMKNCKDPTYQRKIFRTIFYNHGLHVPYSYIAATLQLSLKDISNIMFEWAFQHRQKLNQDELGVAKITAFIIAIIPVLKEICYVNGLSGIYCDGNKYDYGLREMFCDYDDDVSFDDVSFDNVSSKWTQLIPDGVKYAFSKPIYINGKTKRFKYFADDTRKLLWFLHDFIMYQNQHMLQVRNVFYMMHYIYDVMEIKCLPRLLYQLFFDIKYYAECFVNAHYMKNIKYLANKGDIMKAECVLTKIANFQKEFNEMFGCIEKMFEKGENFAIIIGINKRLSKLSPNY